MILDLSPANLVAAVAVCVVFGTLFFFLGRFAERDAEKRAKAKAARRESLERAQARREFRAIFGEDCQLADVIDLDKRRGAQRVKLDSKGVA